MARKTVTLDKDDAGVVLEATLTFCDFAPSGADAVLEVRGYPDRAMSLAGAVASYTTVAGDFRTGYFDAQVRVSKGGVTVSSEVFTIVVGP